MTGQGSAARESELPGVVLRLLDGLRMEAKAGHTLLLTATGVDGWPHVAVLSVGEVLATSPRDLWMALYRSSGTAAALRDAQKGLLFTVVEGIVYKIAFSCVDVSTSSAGRLAPFRARVFECVADEVPYARVLSGVEYELLDPGPVHARWRDQIDWLAALAAREGA